jgi:hypothetical protein
MPASGLPASPVQRRHMSSPRTRRAAEFGVDCTDELLWAGGTWTSGGEYIKKIVLKNVSSDILTLKYKLPTSRFFVMDYPEPVKLRCVWRGWGEGRCLLESLAGRPWALPSHRSMTVLPRAGDCVHVCVLAR